MNRTALPDRMIEIGITTPGPPEVLSPRTVPLPVPARDELLVKVEAAGVSANSIGFSTMSYQTKGVIQLDETKLRTALQANPQQVISVFTELTDSTDAKTAFEENGLSARLSDSINGYLNDADGFRKESFDDQYENVEDSIDRMEDLMAQREERYWRQYTAMESALAKMQSQSDWLSSMLSSSSGK